MQQASSTRAKAAKLSAGSNGFCGTAATAAASASAAMIVDICIYIYIEWIARSTDNM